MDEPTFDIHERAAAAYSIWRNTISRDHRRLTRRSYEGLKAHEQRHWRMIARAALGLEPSEVLANCEAPLDAPPA